MTRVHVYFDGKEILMRDGDHFSRSGIDLRRDRGKPKLTSKEHAEIARSFQAISQWWQTILSKAKSIYHFKLPHGVEIQLTSHEGILAFVKMSPVAGQSGHCGNFNGHAHDDVVGGWNGRAIGPNLNPIPNSESFFHKHSSTAAYTPRVTLLEEEDPSENTALFSPSPANQRTLDNCSATLLEKASKTCDHIPEQDLRFDCKFDVCVTGDLEAALDVEEMELVEVQYAHGIVSLEGDGRCVDSNGQFYKEFKINGTSTDQRCQEILRSLANTRGVRGAELTSSQDCLIAVDPDIDRTVVDRWYNSGWILQEQSVGSAIGSGLVSNATGTGGWSCWKLI